MKTMKSPLFAALVALSSQHFVAPPACAAPADAETRATFHCLSLYWTRPDIGAHEYDGAEMQFGVKANWNLLPP